VFELIDRTLCINIEVKTPREVTLRPNYDSQRLIEVLHQKLQNIYNEKQQLKASHYCFISSFDHEWIERFRAYQSSIHQDDQVNIIYLHTRKIEDILPEHDVTQFWDKGTNI